VVQVRSAKVRCVGISVGVGGSQIQEVVLPSTISDTSKQPSATVSSGCNFGAQVKILGHAGVAITLDICSHVLPDVQEDAAKTMGRLLLRSVWFHNSVDSALFHVSCSVQFRFSRGLCCHFCCHKLTVINSLTCDHAADSKVERIWLPLNADGCRCRNLRTLAAVFVRHRSLLVVRAAVKVAVKAGQTHSALGSSGVHCSQQRCRTTNFIRGDQRGKSYSGARSSGSRAGRHCGRRQSDGRYPRYPTRTAT
jgi:hypothetical protein